MVSISGAKWINGEDYYVHICLFHNLYDSHSFLLSICINAVYLYRIIECLSIFADNLHSTGNITASG